jgi:hypothetical protein
MEDILLQPVEWREKAIEYWDKAQMEENFNLREQFAELAARYLDMAEKLDNQVVAAAILNTGRERR